MNHTLKIVAAGGTLIAALLASTSAYAQPRDGLDYRDAYAQERRAEILFSRGDRLPPRYRGVDYRVEDIRGNNLRKPPRGQYWVRVNNQFLMVNTKTGNVTEVVRIEEEDEDDDRFAGRDRDRDRDRGPALNQGDRGERWRALRSPIRRQH